VNVSGLRILRNLAISAGLVCLGLQSAVSAESIKPAKSSLNNLAVKFDAAGFAKETHRVVRPKQANHPDEPPFMNGEPERLCVTFDNDKVGEYTDYLQKQLIVYPLQPYSSLFKGKEKAAFDKTISDLKKIIATGSDRGMKQLPILPAAEAYEVFHGQERYIHFKNGSGIAFLSCYAQDSAPIKNGDIFYTFQGMTDDGKHYVSFFCPVKAKSLNENMPEAKGVQFLKAAPHQNFQPQLDVIDKMLQTLSLE
jgi:hypothetical protein